MSGGPGETVVGTILVNGEPRPLPAAASVQDLLRSLGLEGRPVAVEVNATVVPRGGLSGCMLKDGDRLEIVTLVGGG